MNGLLSRLVFLLLVFGFISIRTGAQNIYFDESSANELLLGNDSYYEFVFSKTNGSIVRIMDKTTGAQVSWGSHEGSLWANSSWWTWSYSNEFSSSGTSTFSYIWDDGTKILTLYYVPDIQTLHQPATVTVTIRPTAGDYLDMSAVITSNLDSQMDYFSFPHQLTFSLGQGDTVLLPVGYPGVLLESEYFEAGFDSRDIYNGFYHASWVGIQAEGSSLSMYSLWKDRPMVGEVQGMIHKEGSTSYNYAYTHEYQFWLEENESFETPVTRILFGQPYQDSLERYRIDNGIDLYPSLQDKLGDRFENYVASPLLDQVFGEAANTISYAETAAHLERYPDVGLALISWYWEGDFEGNHPDYLPPDPRWGTTEEFIQMIADIQANGKMTLMFTLPIWWNENSSEIAGLSPDALAEIAVIDMENKPHRFNWGPNWGYNISTCTPYWDQRMDQMYSEIFDTYHSDAIYQDVVGARPPLLDQNPACPGPYFNAQAIEINLQNHADFPIIVEAGYDRLAQSVIGFMGGLYGQGEGYPTVSPWGYEGGWRLYPTAPFLFHDKVISYPFWQSGFEQNYIAYTLHFGIPLAWSDAPLVMPVMRIMQPHLLSRIIGKRMTAYEDLSDLVHKSTFEDVSIIWNRDPVNGLSAGNHTVAPEGAFFESETEEIIGGIFSGFNGESLAAGAHYMVVETEEELITVLHAGNIDTPISLPRPAAWMDESLITVYAIQESGRSLVERTVIGDNIRFTIRDWISDEIVNQYEVVYNEFAVSNKSVESVVDELALAKPFPNPFSTYSTFKFSIPTDERTSLTIYDILGREVIQLIDDRLPTGPHVKIWMGTGVDGHPVAPGLYIAVLRHGDRTVRTLVTHVR